MAEIYWGDTSWGHIVYFKNIDAEKSYFIYVWNLNSFWRPFHGFPTLEIHSLDSVPPSYQKKLIFVNDEMLPVCMCVCFDVTVKQKVSVGQSHRGQTAFKIQDSDEIENSLRCLWMRIHEKQDKFENKHCSRIFCEGANGEGWNNCSVYYIMLEQVLQMSFLLMSRGYATAP